MLISYFSVGYHKHVYVIIKTFMFGTPVMRCVGRVIIILADGSACQLFLSLIDQLCTFSLWFEMDLYLLKSCQITPEKNEKLKSIPESLKLSLSS